MAIWHFRASLLPRDGIVEIHGELPKELDEYKADFSQTRELLDEYPNYWARFKTQLVQPKIAELLPSMASWSDDCAMYGEKRGTCIEIWEDDISLKLDTRKPDYTVLKALVQLAKAFDCVFVITESGDVVDPDFENILDVYHNSRAFRFNFDPNQVLDEVRQLQS